jgi:hypothetical protein
MMGVGLMQTHSCLMALCQRGRQLQHARRDVEDGDFGSSEMRPGGHGQSTKNMSKLLLKALHGPLGSVQTITSGFGGSAAGPDAKREGGSVPLGAYC